MKSHKLPCMIFFIYFVLDLGKSRHFFDGYLLTRTIENDSDIGVLCPNGANPLHDSGDEFFQCNASRPMCPWDSYCFATNSALEMGPYYCCPN